MRNDEVNSPTVLLSQQLCCMKRKVVKVVNRFNLPMVDCSTSFFCFLVLVIYSVNGGRWLWQLLSYCC